MPVEPDWAAPPMLIVTFERSRFGSVMPCRMFADFNALYPNLKSLTMFGDRIVVRSPIAFLGRVRSTVALPLMSLGVAASPSSCDTRTYTLWRLLSRASTRAFQKCSFHEDGRGADARSKNGLAVGVEPTGNAASSGWMAGTACDRANALNVLARYGT